MLSSADCTRLADLMAGPHGELITPRNPVDVLVVFSCADPRLGATAARLYDAGLVRNVVFSGGVGKDSGDLAVLDIAEAVFQASIAIANGLSAGSILLEVRARDGGENAEYSLALASAAGLLSPGQRVASLAPAPRSRRLYEELRYRAKAGYPHVAVVAGLTSGSVDPDEANVRRELVSELRGLYTMHGDGVPGSGGRRSSSVAAPRTTWCRRRGSPQTQTGHDSAPVVDRGRVCATVRREPNCVSAATR